MNTSRTVSFKKIALRLIALPAAFVPLTGAFAEDRAAPTGSEATSDSVAVLKSSLPSSSGFAVDDVRVTDAGVACISYRVNSDMGGESRAKAVVEGDKVLRSTSGSMRFQKAWNEKCAGSSRNGT